MPQSKEELFHAFVAWVTQHGWGVVYTRDPHQAVPPDCAFLRVRYPGEVLFTSVGIVQFRTQEEGVTACQVFAASSAEPCEWHMNFPRTVHRTFPSPRFAGAHAMTQSRWYRWKRAMRAWWSTWSRPWSRSKRRAETDVSGRARVAEGTEADLHVRRHCQQTGLPQV